MDIQTEITDDLGTFFIEKDGKQVAELTFQLRPDRIVIEHTGVDEELEGKGIGKKLVDYAVDYARRNKLKVVPLCTFTKAVFKKYKGYEDVL